jgi:cyclopropane-fatty-acyl-phospholipid synthase
MDRLLRSFLGRLIRVGNLQVTTAGGQSFAVGDGTGKPLAIRFTSAAVQRGVLLNPELRFGEAYMDGGLVIEQGSIADVLALVLGQRGADRPPIWAHIPGLVRFLYRRLTQLNVRSRARRNVAHHYDLDAQLYALFLDADRQYSCAYFESSDQSLDDAQLAKKRHLAAKLLVGQDKRVLDIGSGWGGLALYLAEICAARVTGITLSQQQYALAQVRASNKRLSDRVEFRFQDYRDLSGTFDRIVSVGMFEHVGIGFYNAFFRKCCELLDEDGVMLLHSIGSSEGPSSTNPWIAKYIFPGVYVPALSEVLPAVERAGLLVTDIEILRLHYADTLKAMAPTLSRPSGRGRAGIRRALCPDVGVLSCRMRDEVSQTESDGVPDTIGEKASRRATDTRLHRARGSTAASTGREESAPMATRWRGSGPQWWCSSA